MLLKIFYLFFELDKMLFFIMFLSENLPQNIPKLKPTTNKLTLCPSVHRSLRRLVLQSVGLSVSKSFQLLTMQTCFFSCM